MKYYFLKKEKWDRALDNLLADYRIYAPLYNEFGHQDYEPLTSDLVSAIVYNKPKPVSPLKIFFLPVKENVTTEDLDEKPAIIIGVPACDIEALGILDEIYLDESYEDRFYRMRRENTIIIGSDCFDINEHCHCTSYGINPWPSSSKGDLSVTINNDLVILRVLSDRGNKFATETVSAEVVSDLSMISFIDVRHREIESLLSRVNKELPDYKKTGEIVKQATKAVWMKYSSTCVSCGACTTVCPTCTCFLLIDKPGFHKVKQMDACQYPGFEKTAGGEDPLKELQNRFRNRHMCKYVWKPEKFKNLACTGCGRCIEACIGKINKNKLFIETAK